MSYLPGVSHRILIILNGEYFAGVERTVENFSRRIDSRFSLTYAPLFDGEFAKKGRESGLDIRLIPMKRRFDLSVIFKLVKILKEEKFSLIHTHNIRSNMVGRIAARIAGLPVVTHIHSPTLEETTNSLKNRFNYLIDSITSGLTDIFITVSKSLKEELIKQGIPKDKIIVIPACVEMDKFKEQINGKTFREEYGIGLDEPLAGMVALFRPRKGAEYLLEAAAQVVKVIPQSRFAFVGEGEDEGYLLKLKEMANNLGITQNVIFTGFSKNIPGVLASLDCFVLPSLFGEGLPSVLLEAMAMKKPTIATPVQGIPEVVINEKTGFLIPPKNSKALSDALLKIFRDKEMAKKMGEEGRRMVEEGFSAERVAKRLEVVYDRLLEKGS
jgi:glycosyltransferase involved in cell wall biosynthesis